MWCLLREERKPQHKHTCNVQNKQNKQIFWISDETIRVSSHNYYLHNLNGRPTTMLNIYALENTHIIIFLQMYRKPAIETSDGKLDQDS